MKTFARNVDNCAIDVTVAESLDELYHADVVAQFVVVPDGTVTGAHFEPDRGTWTNPAPIPAVPSAPAPLPLLTPMTFYLAFTPAERIAIKKSTDEQVVEFWATYQLAVQLDKPIDPNLVSVKEGLEYIALPAPNGPGILASAERVTQILNGEPQ